MIRTFHSVGQGAFYTEEYKGLNVVYDCGSSTSLNIIINEIKATFHEKEKIDLLFISHFDEDHVNGIDCLLEYCDVKYILLPLQNENDRIYTLIDNYYNSYEYNYLILEPEKFVGERAKVIFVDSEHKNNDIKIEIEQLEKEKTISSGTKIYSSKYNEWFFIPFNFRQVERSKLLSTELENRQINIDSVDDFFKCWKNKLNRKKIIECYRKVPGNFNTNSLTLYSGPINNIDYLSQEIICSEFRCRLYRHRLNQYSPGTLYLGDYDASGKLKRSELEDKYDFIWKFIGSIQIPHHGSQHNFNLDLINKKRDVILIISAGYKNRYRHPHSKVLKELAMTRRNYYIVNEFKGSEIRMLCNIM